MDDFKIDDKVATEFGVYIKGVREKLGISTNKVELLTNIKKADLSRIENGKKKYINSFYLKELARIYRLDVLDLHQKLGHIDERVLKLSKRERVQLEEVMSGANHFFNDESISEEDKKKLYDSLQELYFDAKAKNKRK